MNDNIWIIQNEELTLSVREQGAQLWSLKDKNDNEYLWQGDEAYWADRAPNLFPHVARLTGGAYTLNGQRYEMDIHGFAKDSVFQAEKCGEDRIVFTMCDSEETRKQYPYQFVFSVEYRLNKNVVEITYRVVNKDEKTMYFGVGGHPGFNVPMEDGLHFEDYYLEFDEKAEPKRVGFSEDCYVTGLDTKYPLQTGNRISMRHNLFDDDAIVLVDMSRGVTLASDKGRRSIRVTYPDMPYLGLWHWPKTDAPYICIEPWSTLPARKNIVEDFATQPGMISLAPGQEYTNQFCVHITERQ